MAGKGGKRSTSWKPGQSGNPKGKAPGDVQHSLNWHVKHLFGEEERSIAIGAQVVKACAGDERALELLARLGGETHDPTERPTTVNILALLSGQPGGRELAQRLFTTLALGAGDAGGLGLVREQERGPDESGLDAVAAPDAGQRRAPADRQR